MNRHFLATLSIFSVALAACAAPTEPTEQLLEESAAENPEITVDGNESDEPEAIGTVSQAQIAKGGCVLNPVTPVVFAGRVYAAASTSSYFSSVPCEFTIILDQHTRSNSVITPVAYTVATKLPGAANSMVRASRGCVSGTYSTWACAAPSGRSWDLACQGSRTVTVTCPKA